MQNKWKKNRPKDFTLILVFPVCFSLISFDSSVIRYKKCQNKLDKSEILSVPFFLDLQSTFAD